MSARPSYQQPQSLPTARLEWQGGTPVAPSFDDVYFSRDQGPAETTYVFMQQNFLPERWRNWQQPRAFVVGETGLGTGLNLLVAIDLFLRTAPAKARLHWISTELFPLTAADLRQAHQQWPELQQAADWLQAVYPLAISGFHRLQLHPRISVDLLLGDAASNLAALSGRVDAWCLDGFAPAKNPGMWTPELFQALARASHSATTLATFTCAGTVKRGLQQAGFELEKVPGFGRKREMLRGHFKQPAQPQASATWFTPPTLPAPPAYPERIALVGAGLSGLATAAALARRGLEVDLYEAEQPAAGGSGNRQGVLYIKLAVTTNPASRFYLAGLEFSRRWLEQLDPEQQFWQASGVLQLALNEREAERQARFLKQQALPSSLVYRVSAEEASQLAGSRCAGGGLFYPRAGWVRPAACCQHLASSLPNLRLFSASPVTQLKQQDSSWLLTTAAGKTQKYSQVILATATATKNFQPTAWLPVKAIRGQVSHLPTRSETEPQLNTVVCAGGYVTPTWQQQLCYGASFNLHSDNPELTAADHQSNWQELASSLPQLASQLSAQQPDFTQQPGRVGFRCSSPDYLPLVGPAPLASAWLEDFAPLRQKGDWQAATPGRYYPGLWLNLGHGSRGLASIPLAAELLASQILQEPAPLEQDLVESLHPGRFLIRDLKRRRC